MADGHTHDTFLSPFTWRYGTAEMRAIWSEVHKRRLWRRIWVALAEAQHALGLVSAEEVEDLRAHADCVDMARAHAIETEVHHDKMAELHVFAQQCTVGGRIIHLGATSADVEDNADALRLRESLDLILQRLGTVLQALADQIERWADTPVIGFTHLQPAEPTTLGYRLAQYGQDLLLDRAELIRVRNGIRGKGFKGAVGTSASFAQLLAGQGNVRREADARADPVEPGPSGSTAPKAGASGSGVAGLEARAMRALDLEAFPVTTQTYPRKQDWLVLNALAGLAGSLYKFAFDLRLLQSPLVGELAEPFGQRQVGSSAMPFKRNPVSAENMNSLARFVAALPRVAWDNAAHSLLERTLDDSAARRIILPEAFLATDELLRRASRVVGDLQVNEEAAARNLRLYGGFAATERLLMELVRAGADRQAMHALIREHSMAAWKAAAYEAGDVLAERLAADQTVLRYLPPQRIRELMDTSGYVGDAPERARRLAAQIHGI